MFPSCSSGDGGASLTHLHCLVTITQPPLPPPRRIDDASSFRGFHQRPYVEA
jgi:hypothetical protein